MLGQEEGIRGRVQPHRLGGGVSERVEGNDPGFRACGLHQAPHGRPKERRRGPRLGYQPRQPRARARPQSSCPRVRSRLLRLRRRRQAPLLGHCSSAPRAPALAAAAQDDPHIQRLDWERGPGGLGGRLLRPTDERRRREHSPGRLLAPAPFLDPPGALQGAQPAPDPAWARRRRARHHHEGAAPFHLQPPERQPRTPLVPGPVLGRVAAGGGGASRLPGCCDPAPGQELRGELSEPKDGRGGPRLGERAGGRVLLGQRRSPARAAAARGGGRQRRRQGAVEDRLNPLRERLQAPGLPRRGAFVAAIAAD
mmetsp:Transcript_33514/g.75766  ORF Transcript_33514/g.75766 Transcript_33514/m.75766 type:complete len:310 (-) Transcript_33514:221-1150(-)